MGLNRKYIMRINDDDFETLSWMSRLLGISRAQVIRESIEFVRLMCSEDLTVARALRPEYVKQIPESLHNTPIITMFKPVPVLRRIIRSRRHK